MSQLTTNPWPALKESLTKKSINTLLTPLTRVYNLSTQATLLLMKKFIILNLIMKYTLNPFTKRRRFITKKLNSMKNMLKFITKRNKLKFTMQIKRKISTNQEM